ncbi:MAG: lysophospholipid acyltransferase family protein [Deltaproteobacteria bacterium]|nr:lysophospholipid acyltransferase family protein [Deltaproteobacteria bacterium]
MPKQRLLPRLITTRPAAVAAYALTRLYPRTFRYRIVGEDVWRSHLASGGRVLLAGWHQQFFPAIWHFKTYTDLNPSLMISRSRDGELISGVARRTGWYPVRGSSSSGGVQALEEMIERVRLTGFGGHVVDGPRGPAGRVKKGLIRLAQGAGAAIVPTYVTADRCWYARSWDRFMIPKPGARVTLRFADPIHLEATTDAATLEHQRLDIETLMRRDSWREPVGS